MTHRLAASLAAAFLALAAPAVQAATPPLAGPTEVQDEAIVRQGWTILRTEGAAGLASLVPALQAALDHAPAAYPKIERRDGVTLIRPIAPEEGLILSLMAGERFPDAKPVTAYNVYGGASVLLGLHFNAAGRPADALAVLDRGLSLQPDEVKLIGQKGVALSALGRHVEALALYDPWLDADDDSASDLDRAAILRAKGGSLLALRRLDEAEAAYRQSLVLDPGRDEALRALAHIADQGGSPAPAP